MALLKTSEGIYITKWDHQNYPKNYFGSLGLILDPWDLFGPPGLFGNPGVYLYVYLCIYK